MVELFVHHAETLSIIKEIIMKVKITVTSKHFGSNVEYAEVNTPEELHDLEKKWRKYPQDNSFSTTVVMNGIFENGEMYFKQVL